MSKKNTGEESPKICYLFDEKFSEGALTFQNGQELVCQDGEWKPTNKKELSGNHPPDIVAPSSEYDEIKNKTSQSYWELRLPAGTLSIWDVTLDKNEGGRRNHGLSIRTSSGKNYSIRRIQRPPCRIAAERPRFLRVNATYQRGKEMVYTKLNVIEIAEGQWVLEIQSDNDPAPEWACSVELKPLDKGQDDITDE